MVIIDDNFIKGFANQIAVLTKLQQSVNDAIDDADEKARSTEGEPREKY